MEDKVNFRSRNSLKVNVDGAESTDGAESYKQIPEELFSTIHHINSEKKATVAEITEKAENNDPKMVQEDNTINDGADEQMLGSADNEQLAEKREEVIFIKGDHQNGDAKIDIGPVNGKAFTGMTKEELMKYANDPFWVRLRWIFFIAFWAIWVGMLVGAILIIVGAPKCAAPEPLPWYKRGPLAKMNALDVGDTDLSAVQKMHASGVIYELPAEVTYSVRENEEVSEKIKALVEKYKTDNVNVILDITPNYVPKESRLMQDAIADKTKRSAFIWVEKPEVPNNWLSIVNGSAWAEVETGNFVLRQFGDGLYDLHMNDTIVKKEFGDVLTYLMGLGIKGFRLKNTKFYILVQNLQEESPANTFAGTSFDHTQYKFWTHMQTTFQEGLGDLLYEYMTIVKNTSADAFLSVAEDVIRPEVYMISDKDYGIDIPVYSNCKEFDESNAYCKTWLQWNTDSWTSKDVNPSALNLFVSLVPGVPVISVDSPGFENITESTFKHIEQLRLSPSFMHGDFKIHNSGELLAYSRIKSGNPGYFVVMNPTEITQIGNFSNLGLPDKMSVDVVSSNYNVNSTSVKSKVMTNNILISPDATIIMTYVPVKTE